MSITNDGLDGVDFGTDIGESRVIVHEPAGKFAKTLKYAEDVLWDS